MTLLADALSAALIHSVWQNAIVAFLLGVVLVLLRARSANARYAVSCAALVLMAAIPVVTMGVLYARALSLQAETTALIANTPVVIGSSPVVEQPMPVSGGIQTVDWMSSVQAWALPVWLIGVLVSSLRIVSASAHMVVLKRRSEPADEAVASAVAALAARVGVTRAVTVLISRVTDGPATLGWIRPVILLPPAAALGISPRQLEALLVHELAHIRRHDYLVNVLQMIAETVFFYHPAIWWASRRMRAERELCCDDIAIASCGDALGYAQALARVGRLRVTTAELAVGSSGGPLLRRIQRVLGVGSTHQTMSPAWLVTVVLVMALAVMLNGARAQSPTPALIPAPTAHDAVLRGRVIDAATGRPVPGASVRADYVTSVNTPPLMDTVTPCPIDDCTAGGNLFYRQSAGTDGRFEITGVTPGNYFVASAAPGYIQRRFGQTDDDMPEVPVHAAAGQTASGIDIRLDRAGTITGRIFSDAGEGLFGVEVELLRRRYLPGGARHVPVTFAQTEALGVFQLRDVVPGQYYVRAYVPTSIRPTRGDTSVAYAATFFPAATNVDAAQVVSVASGQEVSGVDFSLVTTRMRTVSGRLVDSDGRSLSTAAVSLLPMGNGPVQMPKSSATADGRFRIDGVTPGEYMLSVQDSAPTRSWSAVTRQISVVDDVVDLVLAAGPSVSIVGRIVRDDRSAAPFDLRTLNIVLERHFGSQMTFGSGMVRNIDADGTFALTAGAATVYLQVGRLPAPWSVKRATLNDVDVTDGPFELRGGTHRLEIVLTDQVSRLSGTVTDGSARAVSNALVVVFPEDRVRWETPRLIRTTFSQQQGRYALDDLPATDYRVVAVTALPRGAWTDPAVLDRLWPASVPVRLQEGQQHAAPLKIIPAPTDLVQ